jgi:hypothetical protein
MRRLSALIVLALAAAGCEPTKTTASGTVTYRGKPVTWGSVALVAADGVTYPGVLQADGSFRIPGVPVGPARVLVRNPDEPPVLKGRVARVTGPAPDDRKVPQFLPPLAIEEWVPVPEKYADPARSGLSVEVRPGRPLQIQLD